MSKAILVLDMPKSCRECPLAQDKSIILEEAYICSPNRKWVTDKECESRQNWCPLKKLPQKVCHEYFCDGGRYDKGYNDCIDEIMRGVK